MAKRSNRKGRERRVHHNKQRLRQHSGGYLTSAGIHVKHVLPEKFCEHCQPDAKAQAKGDDKEYFDKDGYPIPKQFSKAAKASRLVLETVQAASPKEIFRFLDLPAEIRNRIYEFASYNPIQPVCIPDRHLRPSYDLGDPQNALLECTADKICLPCQMHDILGTGHLGLSGASRQLHSEMALIPYTTNTFSTHNLYYLQTFLQLIGPKARRCLKSLVVTCVMPEEEAKACRIHTSIRTTLRLLGACSTLRSLHFNIDMDNMLRWTEEGIERSVPYNLLHEIHNIDLLYNLRGLRDVRICWKLYEGLGGMGEWAKTLVGYWRLKRGDDGWGAVAVETEVEVIKSGGWGYIHWTAEASRVEEVD